jgi:hypothetical protein
MDKVLAATLHTAAIDRLDLLDRLAEQGDPRAHAVLIETEVLRLTAGWRAVLAEHRPDEHGRCSRCTRRRWRAAGTCSVWEILHRCLFDDGELPGGTGRHLRQRRARALLS